MKKKPFARFGIDARKMRPMVKDDILILRLSLLIIMAKAYLKSYPMGEFRRRAVTWNARFVFNEALSRTHSIPSSARIKQRTQSSQGGIEIKDYLFLQRAQLLAVMVHSLAERKTKGNFRKKAMAENINHLCEYLAEGFQLGDTRILKVA